MKKSLLALGLALALAAIVTLRAQVSFAPAAPVEAPSAAIVIANVPTTVVHAAVDVLTANSFYITAAVLLGGRPSDRFSGFVVRTSPAQRAKAARAAFD